MIKEHLINQYKVSAKILYDKGFLNLLINSISLRVGNDKFLINKRDKFIYEDFFSETHFLTKSLENKELSKDIEIHAKIYQEISEYKAVVNIFTPDIMAYAIRHDKFQPFDILGEEIKDDVAIIEVEKMHWDENKEFIVLKHIKHAPIVIVKHIGVFIASRDLKDVVRKAILLDNSCKIVNLL